MSFSPALAAYLALSRLAGPLAGMLLNRRAARGREDPARLSERLGRASAARPGGRLVWLHGASLGEAMSLLPLIAEFRRQDPAIACLVTTGTVTSARRMAELLPPGALHQYVPVDTAGAVSRFLAHWRPDLAVFAESELWPRLLTETHARGIPLALVNARISARSARSWRRAPRMARTLLGCFGSITTQDPQTAERLRALGADPACVAEGGNLKTLVPLPSCDEAELARLRALIGDRPAWLAASTHAPEEEAVAEAHACIACRLPEVLTILAPRHPERPEIVALLKGRGLAVARRSAGEDPDPGTDVLLADTIGEMGLWLRLAPVTFLGASLAALGGHTPFEAAGLGSAILHGPETANFATAYKALDQAGAARRVADAPGLGRAVADLLADPAARTRMTTAASTTRAALTPDIAAQVRALNALPRGRR